LTARRTFGVRSSEKGSQWAFVAALAVVLAWLVTGPPFGVASGKAADEAHQIAHKGGPHRH